MKILILIISIFSILPVQADSRDDTLKHYLSKSELVVAGKIASDPVGIIDEPFAPHYICEFQVREILKGTGKLNNQAIKIEIIRFEMDAKDKHPLIKKDGECILFLKKAAPDTPSWVTSDIWFGVQQSSPSMARSLKRLTAKNEVEQSD